MTTSPDDDQDFTTLPWFAALQRDISSELTHREKVLCDAVFYEDFLTHTVTTFIPHRLLRSLRKTNHRLLFFSDAELRTRSATMLLKRGITRECGVEVALFQWSITACSSLGLSPRPFRRYSTKLKSILSNVANLTKSLSTKELTAYDLVRLTPHQMASNKMKKERLALKQASIKSRLIGSKQRQMAKGHLSDRFKCDACGSSECTYKTRPSRANSKEANNVVIHCTKCSHWWLHYGMFPAKLKKRRLQ
jgi:DNA-directed RNA polymerase subunit M/transcription elongation factor TFIIS